jgi:hypothetical protein
MLSWKHGMIGLVLLVIGVAAVLLVRSPTLVEWAGHLDEVSDLSEQHRMARFQRWIPESARDIHYEVSPYLISIEMNYALDEQAFLQWCKDRGYEPRSIEVPVLVRTITSGGTAELEVRSGWQATAVDRVYDTVETVVEIYYDRQRSRVHLTAITDD